MIQGRFYGFSVPTIRIFPNGAASQSLFKTRRLGITGSSVLQLVWLRPLQGAGDCPFDASTARRSRYFAAASNASGPSYWLSPRWCSAWAGLQFMLRSTPLCRIGHPPMAEWWASSPMPCSLAGILLTMTGWSTTAAGSSGRRGTNCQEKTEVSRKL